MPALNHKSVSSHGEIGSVFVQTTAVDELLSVSAPSPPYRYSRYSHPPNTSPSDHQYCLCKFVTAARPRPRLAGVKCKVNKYLNNSCEAAAEVGGGPPAILLSSLSSLSFFGKPNSFITNGQGATPIGQNGLTDMVVEFFMEKTHTRLHDNIIVIRDSNPPVYNFTVRVADAGVNCGWCCVCV